MIPPFRLVFWQPIVASGNAAPPSNWTVISIPVVPAGKPEPLILIANGVDEPTAPVVGDTETDGTIVLTVAVAVLNDESDTTIVWSPARNEGIVNVTIICPLVNTAGLVVVVTLSIVKLARVTPTALANPDPTIVTVEPPVAAEGLTTLIDGAPVVLKVTVPSMPVVVIM